MNALVIDTATERGLIALFQYGVLTFRKELPFGLQSSQFLLPELQQMLKKLDCDLRALDYIAAGIGPGSYTGIRVGAMAAKTLSFAYGIPLIGISTLDTFVPETEGRFAVLIDAKVSGVYMQEGKKEAEKIQRKSALVCPLCEAAQKLEQIPLIVTPYASGIKQKLPQLPLSYGWSGLKQRLAPNG